MPGPARSQACATRGLGLPRGWRLPCTALVLRSSAPGCRSKLVALTDFSLRRSRFPGAGRDVSLEMATSPGLADRRDGALDRSADYTSCASRLRHIQYRESRRAHADTPAVRAGQPQNRAWAAQQHRAPMPSTSPGPRPCGARVYMDARRAIPYFARFGGRSPHRLQYQKKNRRPHRCRPTCMRDSSPTTTSERNHDRS